LREFDVPEVLEVHVVPSGEVRMVPLSPTATKVLCAHAQLYSLVEVTSLREFDVPEVLEVHVIPSGDVRMVPLSPTATYEYFPKVTPFREFDVPEVLEVHVVRSEEVRMVPSPPTATNDAVESEEVVVVVDSEDVEDSISS
jgi:hypothetical protein